MSLLGKLCIGILEEDNPLRSYFRFKPILVEADGKFAPYEDEGLYPKDGCIRIVPDKNESYYFKSRMRKMGLFCVVDLREHPDENDKIRPNKNYRPDGEETNAYIIYSDVVHAPTEQTIFEILPEAAGEKPIPKPQTERVLIRLEDGLNPQLYAWETIPDSMDVGRLVTAEETPELDALQVFDLPAFEGRQISFAIAAANKVAPPAPVRAPQPYARTYAPVTPAAPVVHTVAPAAPAAPSAIAESARLPEAAEPVRTAVPQEPARAPYERSYPTERPHSAHIEHLRAAQSGLNPRRGPSLQELIDEKWQRSRLGQLGLPSQPISTGAPLQNPVVTAVSAVREAWNQPELRDELVHALTEISDLNQSFDAHRESTHRASLTAELDELEAQKLQLLAETRLLKSGTDDMKAVLKREIYRDEAAELDKARRKTEAAKAEQAMCEQMASDARMAARDAQGLLDGLTGDELEKKIQDVAITRRVLERINNLRGDADVSVPPNAEVIDINGFIDRVIERFASDGWKLSRFEAANLCVCFVISPAMLVTGAPGSGKTTAASMMISALGLDACKRAAFLSPERRVPFEDHRYEAMRMFEDHPAAVLIDNANLTPAPDPLRGLTLNINPEWRVIATLLDAHSGRPVPANTWDAGFTVRLTPPASLPWRPASRITPHEYSYVSIAAIRESLPEADVPASLIVKLQAIRDSLASAGAVVSRRALDEAWHYTSAMLAVLGADADPNAILDLAVSQRLLPGIIAAAPVSAIVALRPFIKSMPHCTALLSQPLPIRM